MINGYTSLLNDHENINRLSNDESNQSILIYLSYNDQQQGIEKFTKAKFLPTTTIHDVIKELLKLVALVQIGPEDVNLIELHLDRRYSAPVENANLTLQQLKIVDGCTLYFQPSLTAVRREKCYLTIYESISYKRAEYTWDKLTTTLNMLLEHIIKAYSLELIERERIHLFKNFEELDLISDSDKLLIELGFKDYSWIDFQIIPSNSIPISFSNTDTSYERLSPSNVQSSASRFPNVESSQSIGIILRYIDRKQNLEKTVEARVSPTTTIRDVIKQLLKRAHLEQIYSEDVKLIEVVPDTHRSIPAENAYMSLQQLNIVDGCTLCFQLSPTAVRRDQCYLTIYVFDSFKKAEYTWYKTTTTLNMLLEHIIETFLLESIERERIRLSTFFGKNLDHMLNSNKLLSDLGITNYESIYVKIIVSNSFSAANGHFNVHVECIYGNEKFLLDVRDTTTIDELEKQIEKRIEGGILIDFKLHNRMDKQIDMSNWNRTLYHLGIKSGEIIYATFRPASSSNQSSGLNTRNDTVPRSSSIVTKLEQDEVIVSCDFSTFESTTTKASVYDTVGELIKKIEALKKSRPLAQFVMCSGAIDIDDKQPDLRLTDLGIKPGNVINVSVINKTPAHYSLASSRVTTSSMSNDLFRTQRFDSLPVGLANLGNTCFMNSALQCLAHVKPLTQFFLDGLAQNAADDDGKDKNTGWNVFYMVGTVTGAYADLLKNLWLHDKTNSYFSSRFEPTCIKETIGNRAERFATWEQQDVQEFMTFLLNEIHKELKENNKNESNTIIEELFFGKIESSITCSECKHVETTTNPISFLSLPLNRQERIFVVKFISAKGESELTTVNVPNNGQVKHIIQAFAEPRYYSFICRSVTVMNEDGPLDSEMPLDKLFSTEVTLIEQEDYSSSSRFDRLNTQSKKLTLEECLREFVSTEQLEDLWYCSQDNCKKTTFATKQLRLCTLPPILIIQFKRFSHKDGIREKIDTFVEYPIDGLDLSEFLPSSEDAIYDLFAVSKHMGSIYGGHYIACVRHEKNKWYKFDDAYVSSFCETFDIVSRDAYLLFYIKRDKPKQLTELTTS